MALDRFIYWKDKKPTRKEVRRVLDNFMGGVGRVNWNKDRFFIILPGKPTASLEGVALNVDVGCADERWIEVCLSEDSIDIITRHGDDFTNALASGLANIFARFWEGQYSDQ